MKKTIILLVIACLGLGSGVYFAHHTKSQNLTQMFVSKDKTLSNGPWTINHPSWTGKLSKTAGNRVTLDINGDTATIISNKNGLLTIKWDRWGNETFQCNNQNVCTLK